MQLFVVRHAIAEDPRTGQDDASRELTKEGRKKLKQVVSGLRALEIRFDRVLTSPWARAAETARLLAPVCADEPIETDLLCQSPRAELLGMIAGSHDTIAVVGHEPWLGELVAWLAFGDTRHGEAIELKKGSVVWLEGNTIPGGLRLRALLPPNVTRSAG
jgi:phosphohistidine phosphatase